MKKRRRCNECRLIAPFPLKDATSIYGSDIVLSARVQLQISLRTQVSSLIDSPIHTDKTTSIIMSSSGFDNAWSTYVCGNNGNSCSSGSTMKTFGNNSSSSTKSWGSSNSSSNMAGSSFGSGSSGFNNAWNAYAGSSSGSSAW